MRHNLDTTPVFYQTRGVSMGWPTQLRCCGLLKYTVLVPSCRYWNINFFHQQYLHYKVCRSG